MKLTDFDIVEKLQNKQLEKHGTTVSEILKQYPDGWIDKKHWTEHYTLSKQELIDFVDWCHDNIQGHTNDISEFVTIFILTNGIKTK